MCQVGQKARSLRLESPERNLPSGFSMTSTGLVTTPRVRVRSLTRFRNGEIEVFE